MFQDQKVNSQIRASRIRLVNPNGEMHGEVSLDEALRIAKDADLDLVQVSVDQGASSVPICKLLDYGKEKYRQKKKTKNNHHEEVVKEMRISMNISDHDLQTKHNKIVSFIHKGYKVKYTMELKGRQVSSMQDEAMHLFSKYVNQLSDIAAWTDPKVSGNKITTTLVPA